MTCLLLLLLYECIISELKIDPYDVSTGECFVTSFTSLEYPLENGRGGIVSLANIDDQIKQRCGSKRV